MATRVSPPRGLALRNTDGCLASRRTASLRWSSRCSAKASLLEALGIASPTTFVLNRYLFPVIMPNSPSTSSGPPLRPLSNRSFGPSNAVRPLRLGASSSDRIVPGVSATSPNTSRCRAPFRRPIPSLSAADASRFSPSQSDSERPAGRGGAPGGSTTARPRRERPSSHRRANRRGGGGGGARDDDGRGGGRPTHRDFPVARGFGRRVGRDAVRTRLDNS